MSQTPPAPNVDSLLRAFADSTRLRIVAILYPERELCVCELVDALRLTQPKVSRHLGVLRSAELLVTRRDGQWMHYRLSPSLPAWAEQLVAAAVAGCQSEEPYQSDARRLANLRLNCAPA